MDNKCSVLQYSKGPQCQTHTRQGALSLACTLPEVSWREPSVLAAKSRQPAVAPLPTLHTSASRTFFAKSATFSAAGFRRFKGFFLAFFASSNLESSLIKCAPAAACLAAVVI